MCFGESPERRNSGVIVRFLPPSLPRQPLPVRGKINLHCLSLSPARSAQRKFFFAILGAKGSSSLCQESSPLSVSAVLRNRSGLSGDSCKEYSTFAGWPRVPPRAPGMWKCEEYLSRCCPYGNAKSTALSLAARPRLRPMAPGRWKCEEYSTFALLHLWKCKEYSTFAGRLA